MSFYCMLSTLRIMPKVCQNHSTFILEQWFCVVCLEYLCSLEVKVQMLSFIHTEQANSNTEESELIYLELTLKVNFD